MAEDVVVRFGANAGELLTALDEIGAGQDEVTGGFVAQADAAKRDGNALEALAGTMKGLGQAAAQTGEAGSASAAAMAKASADYTSVEEQIERTHIALAEKSSGEMERLGALSASQRIDELIRLKNAEFQLDDDVLRKRIEANQGSFEKEKAFEDQRLALRIKHDEEMASLDRRYHASSAMEWRAALAPIDRAFATSIKGIIQGTTTLRQAGQKGAQSLMLSYVEAAEKTLTKWVATQLAMTAATETGSEARQAAGAEEQAGAAATQKTGVLNHAASTAAAVYDDVAQIPYVGWLLAPPAAAVAFAAVAAFGGSISSAAGGWDRVPFDGAMAQLHKDEMVLPASLASPLRAVVAGLPAFGLPAAVAAKNQGVALPAIASGAAAQASAPLAVSFNVSSPDARTFRQMLMDEHGTIANALKKAARNFHPA